MGENQAEAYRTSIVLHVKRVAGQAECLCELVDDASDVVERIVKLLRVGPVAAAESGIIGRDQAVAAGQPLEQWLKHALTTAIHAAEEGSAHPSLRLRGRRCLC